MQALIWDGARLHVAADAPEPNAREGSALIRVHLAGICSTDLQILRGYMGFRGILGHEFVGTVIDGPAQLLGRRVVGEINFACRRCPDCLAGRTRHCPSRTVMGILGADGAFAELLRVPIANVHCVPDEVEDERAVFVEPLAAAIEASVQTERFAGGLTLILGAGKLGLLVAQVLAARGDQVRVVCRQSKARAIAGSLGLEVVAPESPARGYDLVVDATGDTRGLVLALEAVRPLGAIAMKSTVAGAHDLDLAPLVINEVTLIGSRCGDFAPALAALQVGKVRVGPLVEEIRPLSEGPKALESAGRAGALKILLRPGA